MLVIIALIMSVQVLLFAKLILLVKQHNESIDVLHDTVEYLLDESMQDSVDGIFDSMAKHPDNQDIDDD
jgi:septation ring formation regulator EzrA